MSVPRPKRKFASRFIWNLVGNSLYSASQWILIVILARLMTPEAVGSFALMLAIAAPVFLTVGMNLRALQVTDFDRVYTLGTFVALRHVQNVAATAITLAVGTMFGFGAGAMLALLVLCIAKSIESYSQSAYGYYQVQRRLDLVSRSLIMRAALGPALFGLGIMVTGNLWVGISGLAVAWLVVQFSADRRWTRRLLRSEGRIVGSFSDNTIGEHKDLAKHGVLLGVDQGVSSLAVNVPRYAIQISLDTAKVGVYASQAYLAQIITMITAAMLGVVMPELVESYNKNQVKRFLKLIGVMCVFAFVVLVGGVLGALLVGDQLIRWTLGAEYVDTALLTWLMASAGATTLQRVLSKSLEASKRFTSYLWIDLATLAVIVASMFPLVAQFGLAGAAMSMTAGYLVGALLFLAVLSRIVTGMQAAQVEGTRHHG